ncbi:MAG: helix-turn-helix transcriptional regulator [Bacteroidales bacterium]|nr:helix-turn-helix transcriptional regulator [Bacteroidales bacterium]
MNTIHWRITIIITYITLATATAMASRWQLRVLDTPNQLVKALTQDSLGLIWFTTNDGLYSYDGVTFEGHKPTQENVLPFNRIDNIMELADHNILCIQRNKKVIWNRHTQRFEALPDTAKYTTITSYKTMKKDNWQEILATVEHPQSNRIYKHIYDKDDNLWVATTHGLWYIHKQCNIFKDVNTERETVSFFVDKYARTWIVYNDGTVEIRNKDFDVEGYLSHNGNIVKNNCKSGYAIRRFDKDNRGNIWAAGLQDGLIRLVENGDRNHYSIISYTLSSSQSNASVINKAHDIYIDSYGRIWIGDLYGALVIATPQANGEYKFTNIGAELNEAQNGRTPIQIRCFAPTSQGLIMCTEDGIYTCDQSIDDISQLRFYHQAPNAQKSNALPQSIVYSATQDADGNIYVACGNICQIDNKTNILSNNIKFKRIQASNIDSEVLTLFTTNDKILGVTENSLFVIQNSDNNDVDVYTSPNFFNGDKHFSFYPFAQLNDSIVVKGCTEGMILFNPNKLKKRRTHSPIYFPAIDPTGINNMQRIDIDTIVTLKPWLRNFSVLLAVLDYNKRSQIWFAYKLDDAEDFTYTKGNKTELFTKLKPGLHKLTVKSTNGDGLFINNEKTLYIDIEPYFYEKTSFVIVICICIILITLVAIILLHRHMQRVITQRTMQEIENMKLHLNEAETSDDGAEVAQQPLITRDDREKKAFNESVYNYICDHIIDANLSVETIADALNMSRATFARKMKQYLDCTPIDFITATRISRAIEYMKQPGDLSISEIAYNSGFNDPRYFSRCFKKHVGMTPSDYIKTIDK